VLASGSRFDEEIQFLKSLKKDGAAKQCRICITCWQLITDKGEELNHDKHTKTGSFE